MTSRRYVRTAAFVVAAGFAVVACGSTAAEDSTAAATVAPAATVGSDDSPAPTGDGPEILQFTSPLVGGGELDAAELSGTPTAFWFWSPT
jgi:hypothetical protein